MAERHNKPRGASVRQAASSQQANWHDLSRSYFIHHRQVARESLQRLLATPVGSLMTLLVMAIALSLPGVLYVGLNNIQQLSDQWQGASQVSLYLASNLSEADGRDLAEQLSGNDQIAALSYISPAEALAEFRQYSGFSEALGHLQQNPLPAVILIEPAEAYQQGEALDGLRLQLQSLDGVDDAQVDYLWLERLNSIVALAYRISLLLSSLLGVAVVLVVGNTIRLEIENRRSEILVVKLVGGTDAFVRRPFLYTGFWYGLGAAVLAWFLIQSGLWYLSGVADRLILSYGSSFQLSGFGPGPMLILFALGVLLGVAGAWLAVVRHLKAIEPR